MSCNFDETKSRNWGQVEVYILVYGHQNEAKTHSPITLIVLVRHTWN